MARGRVLAVSALAAVILAGGAVLTMPPATAAGGLTRYVATNGTDTGNDCSAAGSPCKTIGHAAAVAAAGDTVSIGSGTYDESATITQSLTITGATTGTTTIDGDGGPGLTVAIGSGAEPTVTLSHLDLSHNTGGVGLFVGAGTVTFTDSTARDDTDNGVQLVGGSLSISRCTITGNSENGVLSTGDHLDVADSVLSDNGTDGASGGLRFGVAAESGSTTIERSTLDGNGVGGAFAYSSGQPTSLTLTDSTSADNGLAGLNNSGGTVGITNSTLSGNHGFGVYATAGSTTIGASTISGTTSPPSGVPVEPAGIVSAAQADVRVSGSIVASQASGVADCSGQITDGGYNLSGDAANSCAFGSSEHDLTTTDPNLRPLADNGGPTQTQLLPKGSPAIDAVADGSAGCHSGGADQRGITRPQGARCDIGAVEVAQPALVISPDTLPHGTVGVAYHATLQASGGLGAPYEFSLAPSSTLPDGLTLSPDGGVTGTPAVAGTFPVTVSVDDPVQKDYTIVIDAPTGSGSTGGGQSGGDAGGAAPTGGGPAAGTAGAPIADTGAHVVSMTALGAGAVFAGFLVLLGAGLLGGRRNAAVSSGVRSPRRRTPRAPRRRRPT